jgi:carbon-monoxide dehydrogenase medium subunit
MEQALAKRFSAKSLDGIAVPAEGLNSDIHADAAYRAHLIGVMARRAVATATGRSSTLAELASAAASAVGLQS